jgi:hypothetical protein
MDLPGEAGARKSGSKKGAAGVYTDVGFGVGEFHV